MNKLIFVDIDGVLTSIERGNSYLCGKPHQYSLDDTCLIILSELLMKVPDSKVIVHSNWVKHLDGGCMIDGRLYHSLLPDLIDKLGNRYLDHTTHLTGNNKGGDIRYYLSSHKIPDPKIVIFDDDETQDLSSVGYRSIFIKCNPVIGLSRLDTEKAYEYLK